MSGKGRKRRGAAITELSIILTVFLILTMGMLDMGIGIFRYHVLAQAARHGVRQAIVHGELATELGSWGPTTIDVPATASGIPIVDELQPLLFGCDLSKTQITVEWPNGSNALQEPVQVTVESPYEPIMLFIFPNTPVQLTASSRMPIAH